MVKIHFFLRVTVIYNINKNNSILTE